MLSIQCISDFFYYIFFNIFIFYSVQYQRKKIHVNCRSTTCPHFDDEYGERLARDRAGNTYMVPGDMTYKEWREKQEEVKARDNIVIPKGYDIHKHSKEIECANLIQKEIGGNVTMINEDNNKMTADMLWNDKLWELKGVTSKTSIDNAVRHGLKQIAENPGGIILNIDKCELNDSDIVKYIEDRLNRSKINLKELNVILVRDKSIYKQLEIIKKEIATSTKTGASSISLQQNNTIKIDKSQLKNDEKGGKIVLNKIDEFKQIGFNDIDKKIYKLNHKLIDENIQQLRFLEDKFGIIKKIKCKCCSKKI